MKITSFNPLIVTKDAEAAIALFEALGFERRHRKASLHGENITDVRLKDANGFHVDVMQMDNLSQDMTAIRMNVDDFGEAYNALTACGFKNAQGNKLTGTGSSYGALMVSPSGFGIYLIKHVKQE